MNYKLIMLPNPILVSDEEKQIFDRVWNSDVEKILRVSEVFMPHGNKIIAGIEGLPKLDLSPIAEKIGWVDVEKLAYKQLPIIPTFDKGEIVNSDTNFFIRLGWIDGFKAAQSLNEKKFSVQDVVAFHQWLRKKYGTVKPFEEGMIVEKCTAEQLVEKFLSKPKEYNVEVEMERTRYPKGDDGWEDVYTPKITNNTIKILKIC